MKRQLIFEIRRHSILVRLCLFGCMVSMGFTQPGFGQMCSDWQWQSPSPQGNDLLAISSGPQGVYACGNRGSIVRYHQQQWTAIETVTTKNLYDMQAGPFLIAVGDDGTVVIRIFGVWIPTQVTLNNTLYDFRGISFGNGIYVIVGRDGVIATSTDGTSWTMRSSGTSRALNGIDWDGTHFWVVGDQGTLLKSSDGISWQALDSDTTVDLEAISYNGSRWVAVGQVSRMVSSTNGTDFDEFSVPINSDFLDITSDGAGFIATGKGGNVATSDDGLVWDTYELNAPSSIFGIAYDSNAWIATSTIGAIHRGDGSEFGWQRDDTRLSNGAIRAVIPQANFHTLADSNGAIFTSTDLTNWNLETNTIPFSAYAGTTNGVQTVIAGSSSWVVTVTAVGNVQPVNLGNNITFRGAAYKLVQWIVVGDQGTIYSSDDGSNWVERSSGTTMRLRAAAANRTRFVAVGDSGTIVYSDDGRNWNTATTPTSVRLTTVDWNGTYFLAGGSSGVLLKSTNGIDWTLQPTPFSTSIADITHSVSGWIAVFLDGSVRTSPNLSTWETETFATQFTWSQATVYEETLIASGSSGYLVTANCVNCTPLTITSSGPTIRACAGQSAQFFPNIEGAPLDNYAWFKDGELLPEADLDLTLDNLTAEDSGTYTLAIGNACSQTTAVIATLSVDDPFGLDLPASSLARGLCPVSLEAETACGEGPITMEWWLADQSGIFSSGNPLVLDPLPPDTLELVLIATDTATNAQRMVPFTFLVSSNTLFRDLNQDGLNDVRDIWTLAPDWRSNGPDANGDGRVDIRDFLYVDTTDGAFCRPIP